MIVFLKFSQFFGKTIKALTQQSLPHMQQLDTSAFSVNELTERTKLIFVLNYKDAIDMQNFLGTILKLGIFRRD